MYVLNMLTKFFENQEQVTFFNFQAKHAIMILENEPSETTGWQEGTAELEVVLKRLPAILNGCNKSAVICKS